MNIRYPNITAVDDKTQLQQIKSYLHQLVDQLNYGTSIGTERAQPPSSPVVRKEATPADTFNSIKALIIKSADIVDSFTESISSRMQGYYMAKSEFGIYEEQTASQIEQNSYGLTVLVESLENVKDTYVTKEGLNDGVPKLDTTITKVDINGLSVDKPASDTKTVVSTDGVTVYNKEQENPVLTANSDGVNAKNLHATTYLIVGENSRFEDYGSRTACFWIGG